MGIEFSLMATDIRTQVEDMRMDIENLKSKINDMLIDYTITNNELKRAEHDDDLDFGEEFLSDYMGSVQGLENLLNYLEEVDI